MDNNKELALALQSMSVENAQLREIIISQQKIVKDVVMKNTELTNSCVTVANLIRPVLTILDNATASQQKESRTDNNSLLSKGLVRINEFPAPPPQVSCTPDLTTIIEESTTTNSRRLTINVTQLDLNKYQISQCETNDNNTTNETRTENVTDNSCITNNRDNSDVSTIVPGPSCFNPISISTPTKPNITIRKKPLRKPPQDENSKENISTNSLRKTLSKKVKEEHSMENSPRNSLPTRILPKRKARPSNLEEQSNKVKLRRKK